MFRHLPTGKTLIAFLLPLTFVWSWAACSILCDEITAAREKQSVSYADRKDGNCLAGIDTDDCPYTADAAVLEARQTVDTSAEPITNIISFGTTKFLFSAGSVYPADVNQNSPPQSQKDIPIFLLIRSFRI